MTSKEKKKILTSYGQLEKRIVEHQAEIDFLWSKIPTSVISSEGGIGGNGDGTKTERSYENIVRLIARLDDEIDELTLLEHRIVEAIHALQDITERRVLTLCYIGKAILSANGISYTHQRLKLSEIADELSYSYDRIRHIHGEALYKIYFKD